MRSDKKAQAFLEYLIMFVAVIAALVGMHALFSGLGGQTAAKIYQITEEANLK